MDSNPASIRFNFFLEYVYLVLPVRDYRQQEIYGPHYSLVPVTEGVDNHGPGIPCFRVPDIVAN